MRTLKALAGIIWVAAGAGASFLAGFALVLAFAQPVRQDSTTVAVMGGAGGGSKWTTPAAVPPAERVIEVVDRIAPAAWKVGVARVWLDSWTASRMKPVKKCSGKAYRCIILKSGRVAGNNVGWSQGSTITIDTAKAQRKSYTAADRKILLVHELGHQFGLKHTGARNVMNPSESRWKLTLTSGQRKHLGKR